MSGFDRSKRLLTPHQFQRVFRRSKRFGDNLLLLRIRYDCEQPPRLGLAISKKHARLAVQRNRIKRQIREQFRLGLDAIAFGDYVFTNKPEAARASSEALRASAARLLRLASQRKRRE
ncbi:MAG: ribonuclease P protein component [Pseudomonadota bacterium]